MFRFPWGDFHSLNLGWFLQKFNELREDWATAEAGIDGALDAEIQKAEDALTDVFAARDAAAASATAAAGSASAAGTSATAAQNSATAAANSATLANNKATAAGLSEAAAAQSATQAGNSATAAAGSATTASTAATNAAASETAAGQSATAAAASETAAGQSATAAAASETNAAASAERAEEVEQSIPADYTELSNSFKNYSGDQMTPFIAFPVHLETSLSGSKITVEKNIFEYEQIAAGSGNIAVNIITGESTPTTITYDYLIAHGYKIPANTLIKFSTFILDSNLIDTNRVVAIRLYQISGNASTQYNNIYLTRRAGFYFESDAFYNTEIEQYILPIFFRTGTVPAVGTKIKSRFLIKTSSLILTDNASADRFVEIDGELFRPNTNLASSSAIIPNNNAIHLSVAAALNSIT